MEIHADIPDSLLCPITSALFREPVMTAAGRTYERHALMEFWRRKGQPVDPISNKCLADSRLISNFDKRGEVQSFLDQHPRFYPDGWPDRTLPPPIEMPEFISGNTHVETSSHTNSLDAEGQLALQIGDFVNIKSVDLGVPNSFVGKMGRVAGTDIYNESPRCFVEFSGGASYYFLSKHVSKCDTFEVGDFVNVVSANEGVPAAYIGDIGSIIAMDEYHTMPRATVEFSDSKSYFFLLNCLTKCPLVDIGDRVVIESAFSGVPTSCIARIGIVRAIDVHVAKPRAAIQFSDGCTYYFLYNQFLKIVDASTRRLH